MTGIAMVAFAGNSLLCRAALSGPRIDAAGFTGVRLLSGALVLWALVRLRDRDHDHSRAAVAGDWCSALALFAYAAFFSHAYLGLTAATGALLLFGAVQATMIGHGLWCGERMVGAQRPGLLLAAAGLLGLLLPGLSAPPLRGAALMLAAGVAWGIYSIRGRRSGGADPLRVSAGNFLRASLFAVLLCAANFSRLSADTTGTLYAVASGALASGVGYAIWYSALRGLDSTLAATVQLSVPMLAALGGVLLLGEPVTLRLGIASTVLLGGIALVIFSRRSR